ncbi:MAG: hypothetical protein ACUVXA_00365 [Candidatus Jordarchaeum sp.]|uniref:hypothetical protein n=1 Tax=Candidatus Jordarchaeum sp. TaxID=2823881 RepID=UPI004049918B
MVQNEETDFFKRLALEAKLIKQKYKTLGTGRNGKLSYWTGYIAIGDRPVYISLSIPEDFPAKPPLIKAEKVPISFNEELGVLKNWRKEYRITDVIDALKEYIEKRETINSDSITSRRLAEELQKMGEISGALLSGSEFVSIRILRDTPSLREYKLLITFTRYSKPRLRGKILTLKLSLPEGFPKMKPIVTVSGSEEDADPNLSNFFENLPPIKNWNQSKNLSEVAMSMLDFFNNFSPPICPICLNKITTQEYRNTVQCRNPRCLSIFHRNCIENWLSQGYRRECVICDTPF